MPRTALTVQQVSRAGLTPAYTAANALGHSIQNTGREFIHVKTAGTPTNVTLLTPGTVDGQPVGDRVIALGATTEKMIGPFLREAYDQEGGEVHVDFSVVTAVTVAAIRA